MLSASVLLICYLIHTLLLPSNLLEIQAYQRISSYVLNFLKQFRLSKNIPVHFVAPSSIDPNKHYLYVFSPHGVFCLSQLLNHLDLNSEIHANKYIYHCVHTSVLRMPLVRELGFILGAIPSDKFIMRHFLKKGSVAITPGGIKEIAFSLENNSDDYIFLQSRKGFIKVAKDADVEIIPVYCWNEQRIVTHNNTFKRINAYLSNLFGMSISLNPLEFFVPSKLTNIFKNIFGEMKYAKLYIGEPIQVRNLTVNSAHSLFLKKIRELFNYAKLQENASNNLVIL